MAASPEGTKVQANFKIGNDLFNVYANSMSEFVDLLGELEESGIPAIHDVQTKLAGARAVAAAVAAPAAAPSGPPASFTSAAVKQCVHGDMVARTGSGSKGPWRGWFCPTPKGTADQCSAIFINRGTPEWNAFPA
jgi:hypothetical protein